MVRPSALLGLDLDSQKTGIGNSYTCVANVSFFSWQVIRRNASLLGFTAAGWGGKRADGNEAAGKHAARYEAHFVIGSVFQLNTCKDRDRQGYNLKCW